jgi:hypothetical protein
MPTECSLSFEPAAKESVAIALVSGGSYDGKKVYLNDSSKSKHSSDPKRGLDFGDSLKHYKSRDRHDIMRILNEANYKGTPANQLELSDELCQLYERLTKSHKNEENTIIELPPDSMFCVVPSSKPNVREVWYIAGPSGSGKSYIAKGLVERYRKQFPDREVFLVSKLQEDDTLDSTKGGPLIRLNLEKLVATPIENLDDLENCMIVFDDYDTFTQPYAKVVNKLIDDIATMGRHSNTTMLCLSHYLSNYAKTRLLLCEATHFVLYPAATGNHALSYLLQTYLGFDKEETAALRKIRSRWICIHKNFPQWVVSEHMAKLLHAEIE